MAIPVAVVLLSLGFCPSAHAIWFGTYGTWDSQTRKDAADAALTAVCNRFNSYGDFNWGSDGWVDVYYDAGVSTANASWAGAMTFGGTWPAERVALHEMNHWLGSVYGHEMNGPRAVAILEQFDGVGARFGSDGTHFWPYGLNYDSEWSEVGAQRNIAIMYAQRGDWGVGPTANPAAWAATTVTLTGSDAVGESGFNFGNKWSDNTFAHPNAAYSTGAYSIRTPQGYPGWKFVGSSLTINAGGQLLYNSWGTDGVIAINGLTLDGGTLKHDQFPQDLFQLGGSVTLAAAGGMVNAANGPIRILAHIGGTGSLTKNGGYTTTLTTINTFSGGTVVNAGTLALASGGAAGCIRGALAINSGATVKLIAGEALGWGSAATAITQITINGGSLDHAASASNGYLASLTLTGGTMGSSGGGAFHINAGSGKTISSLASPMTSSIGANIVIRGANSVLPISVADGAAATDLSITGVIANSNFEAGANGLQKTGAGTLVLGGANTYTGATTVEGGTLAYTGSPSSIGSVTVAAGAALRVQAVGSSSTTLTTTNLTLGAGSPLTLDLNGLAPATPLISTGPLTASGSIPVTILNGGALLTGSYKLISYSSFGGGSFSGGPFVIGTRGGTGALVNGPDGLYLNVTGADRPLWTGLDSGNWQAGSTGSLKSWKLQSAGSATDYLQGDNVLFNDTATGTTVINLAATLSPSATTFNNSSKNYTVSGAGGIAGTGGITKTGTGTLALNTANSYSGGTSVTGGTLIVGNSSALGTGSATFKGTTFGSNAAVTLANAIKVTSITTIGHAGQANNITLSGALSGNGTLKNFVGASTGSNLFLTGNASGYTGTIEYTCRSGNDTQWWRVGTSDSIVNLSGASVILNLGNITDTNAFSKNFGFTDGITNSILKVGALSGNGVFQAAYNNPGPNLLETGHLNTDTTFAGVIAGGNAGANLALTKVGTGTLTLSGTNLYAGTTTINGGAISVGANNNLGADGSPVMLDGGTLKTTAGVSNTHVITVGAAGGAINVATTGQFFCNIADLLRGSGALSLTGTGTLTPNTGNLRLNQFNTYSGNLTLKDGGILEYGASGALGADASLFIADQGEIAVNNGVSLTQDINVAGATNSVLSFENGTGGIVSGPIILNADSNLTIGLRNWYDHGGVTAGTVSGVISGSGGLTVSPGTGSGGTLTLTGSNTFTGNVTVNAATLYANPGNGASNRALSFVSAITVNNGGTLRAGLNGLFGWDGSQTRQITVNSGGTMTLDTGTDVNVGLVTLNGGTLAGSNSTSGWGSWNFGRAANKKLLVTDNSTVTATEVGFHNGASIEVAAGKNLDFTGTITNSNDGVSSVIKQGAGSVTFSGASTYTGSTAVNAGTFKLTGSLANSAVTVAAGATFSGTGNVGGSLAFAANAIHAPGDAVGTQSVSGTLSYANNSRVKWALLTNSNTAGASSRIAAGTVIITTGAALDVVLNGAGSATDFSNSFWMQSRSWTVMTGSAITGSFTLGTVSADSAGHPASSYGSFSLQKNASSVTLIFTPSFTPHQLWQQANFGADWNTPAISGDVVDVDKDGLNNLLEYALGSNPNTSNSATQVSTVTGKLKISFTRNTAATDLVLSVMAADSLTDIWTGIARSTNGASFSAIAPGAVVNESGSGAVRNVEITDIILVTDPAHPKRFLRLEVER